LSFPPEGERPRRPARPRQQGAALDRQTIMVRRAIAAAAGLLVVILLVLGVRGCLNARKDRAFENYAADVRSLIQESDNLGNRLFETFTRPRGGDALDVQNQVNALGTDAEQLVERANGTDHPDELNGAQDWIVTALEFRRDGIARIAQRIPAALADRGRRPAIRSIAGQMQAFLASDVIYSQRALPELRREFADRDLEERFPTSSFLPNLGWLEPDTVASRLGRLGGAERPATPGLHGTGLQSVTAKPEGVTLSETGVNRIAASAQLAFDVTVQNQGESEETDVGVSVRVGNGREISVDQTISRIDAGDTQTVSIPLGRDPPTGSVTEVTVEVAPVPGERVRENNEATYEVVFTEG
jgi:CARDB protein